MKNKMKEIFLLFQKNVRYQVIIVVLVFSVILLLVSYSYAFFTISKEKSNALSLVAGNLIYQLTASEMQDGKVTVEANQTLQFVVNLQSNNSISSNYKLYYDGSLPEGIEIKYLKGSGETTGSIDQAGSEKQVTIVIINHTDQAYTVTFGVQGGLLNQEVVLLANRVPITEEYAIYTYEYTGDYQEFVTPETGFYFFEAWGSQGGNAIIGTGGKGAYASGILYLEKGEKIYVYVGNQPTGKEGGYNGGADTPLSLGAGGGATDFRLKNGAWSDTASLASRILVAGAGGGAAGNTLSEITGNINGSPGGIYNVTLDLVGKNGTQQSGGSIGENGSHNEQATAGSFGMGGSGSYYWGGSGGGGYYGGGGGIHDTPNHSGGGGGGSSYVSGAQGFVAIVSETEITPVADQIAVGASYHYSHKVFIDPNVLNGNQEMPAHTGSGTQIGNAGNGFARITYLGSTRSYRYGYNSAGGMQWFLAAAPGNYQIELWGAQGGGNYGAGRGAYVSGVIHLERGESLYLHVGSHPTGIQGGYNGGGLGSQQAQIGAGGGATDVRLLPGVWNEPEGLNSRIMVAGGGGGSANVTGESAFGRAGGLMTHSAFNLVGFSGTQIQGGAIGPNYTHSTASAGIFGIGGSAAYWSCGGGGGGYYGGGGGTHYTPTKSGGGGGGSSYVSGGVGCIAITSQNDRTPKSQTYTKLSDSYHYSGKIFQNIIMKSGEELVSDPIDDSVITTGRIGGGFARITLLQE